MSIEEAVENYPSTEDFVLLPVAKKKQYLERALATLETGAQRRIALHLNVSPRAVNDWPKPGKPWPSIDREQHLWIYVLRMLHELTESDPSSHQGRAEGSPHPNLREIRTHVDKMSRYIQQLQALLARSPSATSDV